MSSTYRVSCPADAVAAILECEAVGAIGHAHLLRAGVAGRISILSLLPDSSSGRLKEFAQAAVGTPAIILISDDDHFDRGPTGWAQAKRAVKWARCVLVHAAAGEQSHYEGAIRAAQLARRVLIVECGTRTLAAWKTLIEESPNGPGTLVLRPPNGRIHPRSPDRSGMQ